VFTAPLGLLTLIALPAILALYFLRRRGRVRRVASLELWADLVAPPIGGRRRERLERSLSLWLELAAALLLAFAAAGPRGCAGAPPRHLVVVLDGHASMLASAPGAPSALARARAALIDRLDDLDAHDRVTWIESGPKPRVLGELASVRADARDALFRWEPGFAGHDLHAALAFARDLVAAGVGDERLEFHLVTDRFEPGRWPPDIGLIAVGQPLANAGITAAWRGAADPERRTERVEVRIDHFGTASRTLNVEIHTPSDTAGTGPLAARTLELPAVGEVRAAFEIPIRPGATPGVLHIALVGAPDGLAADDAVYLAPEPRAELILAADPILRGDLGLGAALEKWIAIAAPAREGSAEDAHLSFTTSATSGASATWEIVVHQPATGLAAWRGPFLVERAHPLLAGVELNRALWVSSASSRASGDPLVSAGSHVLLAATELAERMRVEIDVDPARSTWMLGPDWPIFLANLVAWRRSHLPKPQHANLRPGEDVVVPNAPAGLWTLRSANSVVGELHLDTPGEVRLATPRVPAALSLARDGVRIAALGVSARDPRISDLRSASEGGRAPEKTVVPMDTSPDAARSAQRVGASGSPLAATLLAIALALLAADGFVLARYAAGRARS